MADFDSLPTKSGDSELQDFLMVEKQKAQVNAQVCNCCTRDIIQTVQHGLFTDAITYRCDVICFTTFNSLHFVWLHRFTNSMRSVGINALNLQAAN